LILGPFSPKSQQISTVPGASNFELMIFFHITPAAGPPNVPSPILIRPGPSGLQPRVIKPPQQNNANILICLGPSGLQPRVSPAQPKSMYGQVRFQPPITTSQRGNKMVELSRATLNINSVKNLQRDPS